MIERRPPTSLGGIRELSNHIIDIEKRLNKIEHHRTEVSIKTTQQDNDQAEIERILGGQITAEDMVAGL